MQDELDRVVTGLIDRLRNANEDYQAAEAVALLQRKDVRLNLPHRKALTDLVDKIGPLREELGDLVELLAVLDDEPFIVLHRASATGYEITISGVAGNFQLETLLAATLRDHIAGIELDPAWIAAATDGPVNADISGQFNLVDHTGSWIGGEGRPADIPPVAGRRVILLEPLPYPRSWQTGRNFTLMRPEITLDQVLLEAEVARWLIRR
jgi:hypothetical protein